MAVLRGYVRPFRKVFVLTALVSMVVAVIEVWLIWYVGRLVDVLSKGDPADGLAARAGESFAGALGVLCCARYWPR